MKNTLRFLLSLVIAASLAAQDKTAAIDKVFNWARADTPGCAVALSLNGKVIVNRAYGSADLERDVALTSSSVFDVGSVQKQFTAAAILLLVEEGRLSLADDVRKHVPELPDYGHKITLDHLLTHTSGIRDWDGMQSLASDDPDAMRLILRQRGLNFAPGEEWSYSNSGYVLLKEIVARTSGMSFAEFTRKRLFDPLGMKSTSYRHNLRELVRNRALAYEKEGDRWQLKIQLDNDRGGGGALLSTAADLLLWNDALTSGKLGAFVTAKLQEPATLKNGRKLDYARGLRVEAFRGGTLISHGGGAGGYHSWLGRVPAHGFSMAVLCNSDEVSASALAGKVGDQFLPAEPADDKAAEGVAVSAADLNAKAGLFFNERTGESLNLAVKDGKLQIAGGPALVALSGDRFRNPRGRLFFMSQDEFELHFTSADRFELKSMEGNTTRYRRARAYAPTADDLRLFAGRYQSDEIGAVIRVEPGQGGLSMRLEHSPERILTLKPAEPDTFQVSRVTVRFVRDQNGKVVALDYSNPVVRNIRFTAAAR